MTAPVYYWPPSGAAARGIALAPNGASGMILADWTTPALWPFAGALASGIVLSGPVLDLGLAGAAPDAASGVYTVTQGGVATGVAGATYWHVSGGSVVSGATAFNGINLYAGVAYASGAPYFLQTGGGVTDASGATQALFGYPARFLQASGTTLYTLVASGSTIGTWAIGNFLTATGAIALPGAISEASCFTVAASPLAVAGWANAPALAGAAALAGDPTYSSLLLGVGSGAATLWASQAASGNSDSWAVSQSVTGLANLTALAWVPNGVQALATDSASGVVQVLDYSGGALSLAQTLAVANAGSVAAMASDTDALVCQTASNAVLPLTANGGTWAASGASLALPSPQAVTAVSGNVAAVAYASGVALLAKTGNTWSVAASAALSYLPTLIAADAFGRLYAAGASAFSVLSGATVIGSGTLASGAPGAMAIDQGRLLFAVPAASGLLVYGQSSASGWTQQGAVTGLAGLIALGTAGTTLFAGASAATTLFSFSGTPYQPQQVQAGVLGVYNGATWATGSLGAGRYPSAIGTDASGNYRVACADNTLWTFTSGAVFSASGAVAVYTGQVSGTPMGFSALLASGAAVYSATSLAGVLVQIA